MTDPIIIDMTDITSNISSGDMSVGIAFTDVQEVELQKVTQASEITGAVVGDPIYQLVSRATGQKPVETYVLGVDTQLLADAQAKAQAIIAALEASKVPFYYLYSDIEDQDVGRYVTEYVASRKVGIHIMEAPIDTTAAEAVAMAANYASEAAVLYAHKGVGTTLEHVYMNGGMFGKISTAIEGGVPWFYQSLNGVPDGGFTPADVDVLYAGYVNTMFTYMKRVETWGGFTTKGTYADLKVAKDWLYLELKEAIAITVHQDAGISMDDGDIGLITNAMKEVLEIGKARGVIVQSSISSPRRIDIPTADRQQRIVSGFEIQVQFAGFVEIVKVHVITGV